ncbi:MAG: hypothetical protein ACRC8M_00305 [Cetobacterium sp.]|uniref:hypothetical protein n=1 Tax=Cetobacterium sp. TaxID=2071632 RepID=UPI003F409D47
MSNPFATLLKGIAETTGTGAATKLLKIYFDENQLIPMIRTWNFIEGNLILKIELKTDRAPMAINEIFLESPNNHYLLPSKKNFAELSNNILTGGIKYMLYDSSNRNEYLSSFTPYTGESINVEFEKISTISIVFIDIESDLKNELSKWKLIFRYNQKLISFDLEELLAETPDMLLYMNKLGIDIETYVADITKKFANF